MKFLNLCYVSTILLNWIKCLQQICATDCVGLVHNHTLSRSVWKTTRIESYVVLWSSKWLTAATLGSDFWCCQASRRHSVNMPTSAPDSLEHFKSLCSGYVKKRGKGRGCSPYFEQLISLICSACHPMEQLQMENGIIIYQGHLTKFCVLWPIKSKCPTEAAAQLMDIFSPFWCSVSTSERQRQWVYSPRHLEY